MTRPSRSATARAAEEALLLDFARRQLAFDRSASERAQIRAQVRGVTAAAEKLVVVPITFAEAAQFVREHHRHHEPPLSAKLCAAVSDGERIRGVAIAGRPVSRMLDDTWTLEVYRVATDGARNACSMLYRAIWRAARSLGYRRLVTYTLPSEGGGIAAWCRVPRRSRDVRRHVVAEVAPARGHAPVAGEAALGGVGMTTEESLLLDFARRQLAPDAGVRP